MGKLKFYAVAKGKTPGIYYDWASCQEQVSGFGGAVFKGFSTEEEAKLFLGMHSGNVLEKQDAPIKNQVSSFTEKNEDLHKLTVDLSHEPNTYVAYVDGSFSEKGSSKVYSSGFLIIKNGEVLHRGYSSGRDSEVAKIQNVAGELISCMLACQYIGKNHKDCRKLVIAYDYEGIKNWAIGTWKAKNKYSIMYQEHMQKIMKVIDVNFIHTKGHVGILFNEEVDRIAGYAKDCELNQIPFDMDYFMKHRSYFK